ncbi:MAG: N-formylglutamate amidohydrolase [Polyangiaceae bacterium]
MIQNRHFDVVVATDPGPVVVEIPHAGVVIDADAARFTKIPNEASAAGAVLSDSDVGADLLWEGSEARRVTRVVARASRHVIDLNTEPIFPTPYEEKMPDAMRQIRHRSQCGVAWWVDPLPRAELERRVREVFDPYHATVAARLDEARAAHGFAILFSAHTYPARDGDPDVVIGTRDGASASSSLRDAIASALRAAGLAIALEHPFPGAYSLARHARPTERVSALQLEVHRALAHRADVASALAHAARIAAEAGAATG